VLAGAVRNHAFPVSRAPIALFAIRHMAPHDLLFLHDRREWFASYQRRYAGHITSGRVRDPFLRELYNQALRRHSQRQNTPRPRGRADSRRPAGPPRQSSRRVPRRHRASPWPCPSVAEL
jgi:hypothetical protein